MNLRRLGLSFIALLASEHLSLAQNNFTMPPPAGVVLIGAQVVAACGAGSLAATQGYVTVNVSGQLCTNASGGSGGLSVTDQAAWTQAVSSFTPGGGTFNDTATLSSGQQGTYRLTTKRAQIVDTDTTGSALYSALTAPVPAGANIIGKVGVDQTTMGTTNGVAPAGVGYETVAASATAQVLGGSGAVGDYLSHCVIYPVTTAAGAVTVFDNTNAAATNVITFATGTLSNLAPIPIPVGAISTAGAWKVTTGTNVTVTCYGKFT